MGRCRTSTRTGIAGSPRRALIMPISRLKNMGFFAAHSKDLYEY